LVEAAANASAKLKPIFRLSTGFLTKTCDIIEKKFKILHFKIPTNFSPSLESQAYIATAQG
jgi:hypothetical protein